MIEAQPGATSLGGYEILYQLKAGGMGEVLLARRRGPSGFERLAAVKTIRAELREHEHLRRMFLDEAQLLARLSHPAIAQIYDFGEDAGTLFLAMEYVAGVAFRDLIAQRILPPAVSARAMAEACRGLHAAHQLTDLGGQPLGVVHRDVSPDNLMLTFDGQVKVLDFGIALTRGRQAPVTELGTIKGKPPYLSPEQIKNQPVDRRTDVFAAAVVLHEMLTFERVFAGDSLFAVARAIELDPIQPPSVIAGPLPAGLDEAVMRGLERAPDDRWQDAADFARALDQAAADSETLADFAGRALDEERERHRAWLARILDSVGTRLSLPAGRPSGVRTAAAPKTPGKPRVTVPMARAVQRRWLFTALLVLAAAAASVAVVFWALRLTRDQQARTADATPVIAAAPVPIDAAAQAPIDAAAPVPIDAGLPRKPGRIRKSTDRVTTAPSPDKVTAAPPAATGFITVTADPWGNVAIDGAHIKNTPLLKHRVEAGEHEVVVTDPADGAVRLKRRIRVEPGAVSKLKAP
jgi:predicted Ser/Thr protein kinase